MGKQKDIIKSERDQEKWLNNKMQSFKQNVINKQSDRISQEEWLNNKMNSFKKKYNDLKEINQQPTNLTQDEWLKSKMDNFKKKYDTNKDNTVTQEEWLA